MGSIFRGGVQRTLDHLSDLCIRYCSWSARTIFVSQSFNATLNEPAAPFANCVLVDIQACGDLLALEPLRTQQHHPAAIRKRTRCFVAPDLRFEKSPVRVAQYNQIRLSTDHHECS
jgi:hypothetical protein